MVGVLSLSEFFHGIALEGFLQNVSLIGKQIQLFFMDVVVMVPYFMEIIEIRFSVLIHLKV